MCVVQLVLELQIGIKSQCSNSDNGSLKVLVSRVDKKARRKGEEGAIGYS